MTARLSKLLIFAFILYSPWVSSARAQNDYTLFESGHVRPMAMSPDGNWLYVVNTPDAHVEAYVLGGSGALHIYTIPVGLEPVAVAAPSNDRVWVVNHLSDSVSIIDTSLTPPRVLRTLHVGDEPRDIVFASGKAFITTAHRGQNTPWPDGDYDTPGIGRADVWVFDANDPGPGMGGTPITVVNLFGDRPRALAASPDGTRVYASVFRSGNQSVAVSEGHVCNGSGTCSWDGTTYPGGRPFPEFNFQGTVSRETGLVVKFDAVSGEFRDELNRNWNPAIPFSLPDQDVFEIDAAAATPTELGAVSGVGTILFNMIVNPVNGDVYVSNTDTNNRVRFEGHGDYVAIIGPKDSPDPGVLPPDPPSVRGNLARSHITVLDASGDSVITPATEFSVVPRHLNSHIPYGVEPVPAGIEDKSVATPMEMAISSDGGTLYLAGFGSNSVHIYDTTALKNGSFDPMTTEMINLPTSLALGFPGGASGLVLDEGRGRLYVASRTTNEVYIYNTSTKALLDTLTPHNPEPPEVTDGRRFLYDAKLTGSNGEASCSSCHIFGDMDDLSWDLGDPDAIPFANNNPKPEQSSQAPNINALPNPEPFDALKGPMTTQSLRGMVNSGPMHWRGDRTGPACASIDVNRDPACESQAFDAFNVAFPGLVGRDEGPLQQSDMDAFTTFALRLTYPPNPIRALDNSLTPQQQAGANLYSGRITDIVATCNGCHVLDRAAGFFGTSGGSTFENETMEFKVPHLRNAYQKVGMFGMMPSSFFPNAPGTPMGPQVRGTGYLHDGSVATVFDFLSADVFDQIQPPIQNVGLSDTEQRDLEAFIMAFDTDLAPIVGQQVTLGTICSGGSNDGNFCGDDSDCPGGACSGTNLADVQDRINLLIAESGTQFTETNELHCEMIISGVINGEQRNWYRVGPDLFVSDTNVGANWTQAELLAAASVPGQALTATCVPPGSGFRMAIDRDRDGLRNYVDPFPDFYNSPDCSIGPSTPARNAGGVLLLLLLGVVGRRVAAGRGRRR